MASLLEDIDKQSKWIQNAFSADELNLDFTIRSFIQIDRFFNRHVKDGVAVRGGRLVNNLGGIIFSIGSYVGATIINTVPGSVWQIDDNDPEGEVNVSVKFPDGTIIWPMQRIMKRFQNGSEDSIYVYGHQLTKKFTKEVFDQNYWAIENEAAGGSRKKWWKFW
jgi:hypothetical protein